MDALHIKPNRRISHYEGLVRKTAASVEPFVEDDFDEICQFLREKVWKGIEGFSPERVRTTSKYSPDQQLERFVFSCVQNGKKDVLKKKKRGWLYIEDMLAKYGTGEPENELHDSFESRYMAQGDTFAGNEPEPPTIPSTLNERERHVVVMLYDQFKIDEIAAALGLRRSEVRETIDSIRLKLADWAPTPPAPAPGQVAIAA